MVSDGCNMSRVDPQVVRKIVADLRKTMQCNCDLGRWEPEKISGHSWVCRIHKKALELADKRPDLGTIDPARM
jgi:hypothetical protein